MTNEDQRALIERAQDRWIRLPDDIKYQLSDYFNLWLGVANLVDGRVKSDYAYERFRFSKEHGIDYKLARDRAFRIQEYEERVKKDVEEHIEELRDLAKKINDMAIHENIDLEKLTGMFNLAMVFMYGEERKQMKGDEK